MNNSTQRSTLSLFCIGVHMARNKSFAIANALPRDQQLAIFAKQRGGGGGRSGGGTKGQQGGGGQPAPSPDNQTTAKPAKRPTHIVSGTDLTMDPTLMEDAYNGDKAAQEYDMQLAKPPMPKGAYLNKNDLIAAQAAAVDQWGKNMAQLANERIAANQSANTKTPAAPAPAKTPYKPTTAAAAPPAPKTATTKPTANPETTPTPAPKKAAEGQYKETLPTSKAKSKSTPGDNGVAGDNGILSRYLASLEKPVGPNATGTEGAASMSQGPSLQSKLADSRARRESERKQTKATDYIPGYTPSSQLQVGSTEWHKARRTEYTYGIHDNGVFWVNPDGTKSMAPLKNATVHEVARLITNAIGVVEDVIANGGPMSDAQRRAMFAQKSSGSRAGQPAALSLQPPPQQPPAQSVTVKIDPKTGKPIPGQPIARTIPRQPAQNTDPSYIDWNAWRQGERPQVGPKKPVPGERDKTGAATGASVSKKPVIPKNQPTKEPTSRGPLGTNNKPLFPK